MTRLFSVYEAGDGRAAVRTVTDEPVDWPTAGPDAEAERLGRTGATGQLQRKLQAAVAAGDTVAATLYTAALAWQRQDAAQRLRGTR